MTTPYPWPTVPPTWLLPWLIWRFRGGTAADRPASAPAKIPDWASKSFIQWCAWKRKGEVGPRPPAPAKIPQWAWPILKQLNIAVPLTPPPPPPPPAPPIPATSWNLRMPIMYTSHGWQLDSGWRNDDKLRMAQDCGVGTIALQGGMFLDDTGDRCRDFGFDVAVWGSPDTRDAAEIARADAKGYIPQIEGKYEFDRAVAMLQAGTGAGLSLSCVTTNAGLDTFIQRPDGKGGYEDSTEQVELLMTLGLTHAQVECYWADMSPNNVGVMVSNATHRGFYHITPCLSYLDIHATTYGRQVAVFLGEPMSDAQWQQLKAL
jgi:hypothetical protein